MLEHLMEQVNDLHDELEVLLKELIPMKNAAVLLHEAIDLDKFLKQLKVTLKHLISTHLKLIKLLETVKDEDAKSRWFLKGRGCYYHKVAETQHPKIRWRPYQLENILGAV